MSSYNAAPDQAAIAAGARARVSWSAIFAGVVIVVAIEILLSTLGTGIGLGFVNTQAGNTPDASSFGTGAGIWWLATTIVALVVGGFSASRLAGVPTRFDGVLHGAVIWGVTTLLTLYLLSSAVGGLLGGAFSAVGGTVSAVGSAAGDGAKALVPSAQQATGLSPDMIQQQADGLLQGPTPQDPATMSRADAVKAIGQSIPNLVSGGDSANAAKQRITDIVAAQAHISPQDAQQRVTDAQARFDRARADAAQKAKQAADATAKAGSRASFLAFAGLLVGAVAATIGGALASPRRVVFSDGPYR